MPAQIDEEMHRRTILHKTPNVEEAQKMGVESTVWALLITGKHLPETIMPHPGIREVEKYIVL